MLNGLLVPNTSMTYSNPTLIRDLPSFTEYPEAPPQGFAELVFVNGWPYRRGRDNKLVNLILDAQLPDGRSIYEILQAAGQLPPTTTTPLPSTPLPVPTNYTSYERAISEPSMRSGSIRNHNLGSLLKLDESQMFVTVTGYTLQGEEVSGIRRTVLSKDSVRLDFAKPNVNFTGTLVYKVVRI